MRGARVCSLGELDVGRVVGVVGVGTVVRGTEVVVVSGASSPPPSSPPSPPPESPPPPGALGIVVEVGGTVVVGEIVVDGEEACGGLALRRE